MKGYLFRAVFKRYWKLLLSIMLVSALGYSSLAGLSSGHISLKVTLDDYMQDYNCPDAVITTAVTNRKQVQDLLAVPGIAEVNARLTANAALISPEGRYLSIRAFSYSEDEFQRFIYWEQADAVTGDTVLLEYNFAYDNDIQLGDTVQVMVNGDFRPYTVAGIISRPETFSVQPMEEIEDKNRDFGYVYAPRFLLEKETEAERSDAMQQLDEKSGELHQAEQSAHEEYQQVLTELDSAEAELNAKTEEFAQTQQELTAQRTELEELKEELLGQQAELEEKRTEAENSKKELESSKAEAREKEAELNQGQTELNEKRAELHDAEQTFTEQRNALLRMQKQALAQGILLMDTRDALLSGKEELQDARKEALNQRYTLYAARNELSQNIEQLEERRDLLQSAKSLLSGTFELTDESIQRALDEVESLISTLEKNLDRLETARANLRAAMDEIAAAEIEGIDTAELRARLQQAVDQLAALGLSADTVDGAVQQARDALAEASARKDELAAQLSTEDGRAQLQERLRAMLGSYVPSGTITEIVLDAALGQVNSLYGQAQNGMGRINNGLRQIREGLQLADEKELEIDSGLMQVQAGNEQLNGALRQIADGFSQLGEADEQIAEGRAEIERYQAQIDEGRQALNEGYAQLADYQAQLDEGFEQLQTGQTEIANALEEIEDGKRQIDEVVAEARQQLADGEAQLADKRAEAESGWVQALADFADMKNELQRAYDDLAGEEGYEALCNQFLLRFTPDAPRAETLEAARAALGDTEVKSAVLHEDSAVRGRIRDNVAPLETMMVFVPALFFTVALVVVYLFMALIIRQSRREIGILRALGFSRGSVAAFFCAVNFLVSLGAVGLGLAIGLALLRYIGGFESDFFPLAYFIYVFDWKMAGVAGLVTIAVGQAATLISTVRASGVQPTEAMSRQTSAKVKIPRAAQWAVRGASPMVKYSVISLMRNPVRFLFSVVCLSASVMLIFTAFSFIASKNAIITQLFDKRIHYDCQIFYQEDEDGAFLRDLEALPWVSDVEPMDYYTSDFSLNGRTETSLLNAMRAGTGLITLLDEKGGVVPVPEEGAVLDKQLAETLGAQAGDTVRVDGVPLKITAISDQSVGRTQSVSSTQAQALGEPALRSVICRVQEADEGKLMEFLIGREAYIYSVFTRMAYASYYAIFITYDVPASLVAGFAVLIGLVIVVNTGNTNLLEQKRQLSVLRALGFQQSQISRSWYVQSLLYFLFSLALGLPGGIVVAKMALFRMSVASRTYPFVHEDWVYALTAGLVLAYITFSHFMTMWSMKKWNIVENVKDKE